MPVTPQAVAFLADLGHDAVHASAVGLATATDSEILAVARREQRIVVTADLDYPRLLAAHQTVSPGIVLFRGGSYSDQEMLALLGLRVTRGPSPSTPQRRILRIDVILISALPADRGRSDHGQTEHLSRPRVSEA